MTVAVILCTVCLGGNSIEFEAAFYFVCYAARDNAISAGAISGAVSNYGGAGYVLEYGGEYYVTVACYYEQNDAERIRQSLLRRGLNCNVLAIETGEYRVTAAADGQLYVGNLNTLFALSKVCYQCANGLDTGEYGQSEAKSVIDDVKSGLNGLKYANADNLFSGEIRRLIAECDAASENYIYSKDLRKLQIAIADTIINIRLV